MIEGVSGRARQPGAVRADRLARAHRAALRRARTTPNLLERLPHAGRAPAERHARPARHSQLTGPKRATRSSSSATLQGTIRRAVMRARHHDAAADATSCRSASTQLSDARGQRVAQQSNAQIDAEVAALEEQHAAGAQAQLFWQSALLLPLTLLAILVLTLARRAGRCASSTAPSASSARARSPARSPCRGPHRPRAPRPAARVAAQRLLDLAQERNRFLRHMSHELKTPLANIREGTELLMDGAVGRAGLATSARSPASCARTASSCSG